MVEGFRRADRIRRRFGSIQLLLLVLVFAALHLATALKIGKFPVNPRLVSAVVAVTIFFASWNVLVDGRGVNVSDSRFPLHVPLQLRPPFVKSRYPLLLPRTSKTF